MRITKIGEALRDARQLIGELEEGAATALAKQDSALASRYAERIQMLTIAVAELVAEFRCPAFRITTELDVVTCRQVQGHEGKHFWGPLNGIHWEPVD